MQRTKAEKNRCLQAEREGGVVGEVGGGWKVGKVPAEKDEKCCGKVDASMHCHAIIMKFECSVWQRGKYCNCNAAAATGN